MAVGKLFHIIHMTGQLDELEAWYDDVFAVKVFMPHSYMPGERRDASLVLLGDTVIEPLAPAFQRARLVAVPARPVLQPVRRPLALHRVLRRRHGRHLA